MATSDPTTTQIYGSSLTIGIFSQKHDRALVHCIDRTLSASNPLALRDAVDTLMVDINPLGPWHPQQPTLPMQTLTMTRFGPTKALGTASYWRNNNSLPHPPGQPIVAMDGALWSTDWCRSGESYTNGYPSGAIIGLPPGEGANGAIKPAPKPRTLTIPVIKMYIPTVLSFNPYGQVGNALGCVNSQALTYGGVTILADRIRFDNLHVDGESSTVPFTPAVYQVVYEFSLAPAGFYEQHVYFGYTTPSPFPSVPVSNNPPDQWRTRITPAYRRAAFPQFPTG